MHEDISSVIKFLDSLGRTGERENVIQAKLLQQAMPGFGITFTDDE